MPNKHKSPLPINEYYHNYYELIKGKKIKASSLSDLGSTSFFVSLYHEKFYRGRQGTVYLNAI